MTKSQHYDHIAAAVWLAAIALLPIGGFVYNGAWLLSVLLWCVGAWFAHLSHVAGGRP